MRNYYIFTGFLSLLVIMLLIFSLRLVGLPASQQSLNLDSARLTDFSQIKYGIDEYYRAYKKLPTNLSQLTISVNKTDPITKKPYEFKVRSDINYQLCTDFSTDTTYQSTTPYKMIVLQTNEHKKGFDCIDYSISDELKPTPTPIPLTELQNKSFETWNQNSPYGWILRSGEIHQTEDAYDGKTAVEFKEKRAQSILTSQSIKIGTNLNYIYSLWYKSNSSCTECAFIGFRFFDPAGNTIKDGVTNCGEYNPFTQIWYQYIKKPSSTYSKFIGACTFPSNTYLFDFSVGIWNESDVPWKFDYINLSPQTNKLYPNETSDMKPCPGPLQDGMCNLPNCSYSYPNDIYTKGKIIVGDAFKKYGRPSGTFYDECTSDRKQVKEAVCSATTEGNYGEGWATYPCPKGCVNGACIE